MSTTGQHRTRAQRVAERITYVGLLKRMHGLFFDDHGLLKVGLIIFVTMILCLVIQAWNPPFRFRLMATPDRDIVCRAPFSVASPDKTEEAKRNARLEALHVYVHDTTKLSQFKAGLVNTTQSLLSAENYASMKEELRAKWKMFLPPNATDAELGAAFTQFQKTFETDVELSGFKKVIDQVFLPYEKNGILLQLHGAREGNQERIIVYDLGINPMVRREVPVLDVLIGNAYMIKDRLNQRYDYSVAELLFQWIRPLIPETLSENKEETTKNKESAAQKVGTVLSKYEPGQTMVPGGKPIDVLSFQLLKEEYRSMIGRRGQLEQSIRGIGAFLLIFIMFFLSYFFVLGRLDRTRYPTTFTPFAIIYGLTLLTVLIGRILQIVPENRGANPEFIPLLIFAHTITIVFSWEVAIFTTFVASFILAMGGWLDLGTFLSMIGTISVIIVLSRDIRTRGQIIFISLLGGITAFVTSYSIGLLQSQLFTCTLFFESVLKLVWCLLAGFLFAGLLPFIERIFGTLTPMRLMEIGNPSHPLLQELARRAPATYNHSVQTAAIAEAAADAIGAKAALVRVGAYFHDIGKMLNPLNFTENQPTGSANIHDSLEPRISTLIIVAHVKDGVDLARQHHLPQQVIDLIEEHHGTMLVGFFYEQANKMSINGAYNQGLDESSFRYPGPTPQSKEAGILMMADAVESACRSMGDDVPPGRITNLVRSISEKRMEDGQFDDSGLTLGEIRTIENSMITSILASRHSRIKYPEKETRVSSVSPKTEKIERPLDYKEAETTRKATS